MFMENVTGTKIDDRTLPKFTWNADLIAFDGPLLSWFSREDSIDALFVWLDCDHLQHRWAIIDISRDCLTKYLTQKFTLLNVFQASSSVIVFDQSENKNQNYIKTKWDKLPEDYLPAPDSFLTPDIATADALEFARKINISRQNNCSFFLKTKRISKNTTSIPKEHNNTRLKKLLLLHTEITQSERKRKSVIHKDRKFFSSEQIARWKMNRFEDKINKY